MPFVTLARNFSLAIICAVFLGACGTREPATSSNEVQDITPGEKSIIQPPSAQPQETTDISERNI